MGGFRQNLRRGGCKGAAPKEGWEAVKGVFLTATVVMPIAPGILASPTSARCARLLPPPRSLWAWGACGFVAAPKPFMSATILAGSTFATCFAISLLALLLPRPTDTPRLT